MSTKRSNYFPPIAQLSTWIANQMKRKVVAWFSRMLKFKTMTVKMPFIVRVKGKTHVQMQHVLYTVPTAIQAARLKAFKRMPHEKRMVTAMKPTPRGLRTSRIIKRTFKKVKDTTIKDKMKAKVKSELKSFKKTKKKKTTKKKRV